MVSNTVFKVKAFHAHSRAVSSARHVRVHAAKGTQVQLQLQSPGLKADPWTGSAAQLQALQQLQQRFKASPYGLPDESTLKWYLRDRYFDVDEAESKLKSMLRWRKEFKTDKITLDMVQRELSSGKAYVHDATDTYGRPAIIIRARLHKTGEYRIEDSKRLCVYLLDEALRKVPEGGEQIIGIFDLRNFSVENADFEFARFMVEAFFEYYPRRVAQVLFVEAPWVFKPAWEVIKPLMRKYKALVRFITVPELRAEYFTPTTLPLDFR